MRSVYFTAALVLIFSAPVKAELVERVIDGDTVVLAGGERVRLIGIDAPEIENKKYNRTGEYFGPEAEQFLRKLVEGREVQLEADHEPFDKYGRRLAYLFLDGEDVNLAMIRQGYAQATRFFTYVEKENYLKAEEDARTARKGMWAPMKVDTFPEEKKEFRFRPLMIGLPVVLVIMILTGVKRKWRS